MVKDSIDPSGSLPPSPAIETLLLGAISMLTLLATGRWLAESESVRLGESESVELGESELVGLAESESVGLAESESVGLAESESGQGRWW